MTLKKTEQLSKRQNSSCENNVPKQWNFNVTNEKVLELVLKNKCGFPINKYAIQMMALKAATSLRTTQQDFVSCKGRAVRIMHLKGYILYQRSTSDKSFPQSTLSCERMDATRLHGRRAKEKSGTDDQMRLLMKETQTL
jgi:hypothetical protein